MNKILIISNRSFEYQLVQRSVNHSLTILTLCRFDHNVSWGQKTTIGFCQDALTSQKAHRLGAWVQNVITFCMKSMSVQFS